MVTLGLRSCVARQEPYIPGALSILQGTVPGRIRGSGHMVPTYFRRELRDRVLQRPSRLRAFFLLVIVVMPGLVPGIHVLTLRIQKFVDGGGRGRRGRGGGRTIFNFPPP